MGGRELSEYGLPHPQTVDNDRFARVYCIEIDYDPPTSCKLIYPQPTITTPLLSHKNGVLP